MTLKDTQRTIFLNAGHHNLDPGHVTDGNIKENEEVKRIRDLTVAELKFQGFKVEVVPDNLTLRQSIDLVNVLGKDLDSGLALDIHLNAHGKVNQIINGTEVYSGTSVKSMAIADTLSRYIANGLGTEDRGYKPDTWTAAGSLGWIRQTNMWACVVECCYLTDPQDRAKLMNGGHAKIARGITKAICELFAVPYLSQESETPREEEVVTLQRRVIELTILVVSLLQKLINLKSTKENRMLGSIFQLWRNYH